MILKPFTLFAILAVAYSSSTTEILADLEQTIPAVARPPLDFFLADEPHFISATNSPKFEKSRLASIQPSPVKLNPFKKNTRYVGKLGVTPTWPVIREMSDVTFETVSGVPIRMNDEFFKKHVRFYGYREDDERPLILQQAIENPKDAMKATVESFKPVQLQQAIAIPIEDPFQKELEKTKAEFEIAKKAQEEWKPSDKLSKKALGRAREKAASNLKQAGDKKLENDRRLKAALELKKTLKAVDEEILNTVIVQKNIKWDEPTHLKDGFYQFISSHAGNIEVYKLLKDGYFTWNGFQKMFIKVYGTKNQDGSFTFTHLHDISKNSNGFTREP